MLESSQIFKQNVRDVAKRIAGNGIWSYKNQNDYKQKLCTIVAILSNNLTLDYISCPLSSVCSIYLNMFIRNKTKDW